VIVSIAWLSELLGRELDAHDVAHRLAMLGAPVEAIEELNRDLDDVIVGLVEKVERHPNADRLTLCHVNDGTKVWEVVCGAPNVRDGAKYPYAPTGATLPGGLKLSARKIRGVVSNGMLCSAQELGLGTDSDGIMELLTDAAPGTRLVDVMPMADTRLDVEVTANRPDLLGHRGVARELAAVYDVPVKLPVLHNAPSDSQPVRRVEQTGSVDGIEVRIDDRDGSPRYMAAVIRGVKIGPSPAWLTARLRAIGARPINNVVDATNYILFELNQPMHAFDVDRLRGDKVVVRSATKGERLTTLDGESQALDPNMTMICDAEGPIAVGGVMGGLNSEVTETTTDILLECAYFDAKRIRHTRQALKMSTDASYRFERGTDPEAMEDALRRAVSLIRAVAGGEEAEGAIDVYPKPHRQRAVFLRTDRVEHLLGTPVPVDEIERLLTSLGFAVAPKDGRLHVQIPGWRPDVTREIDLIEEVARLRGYDSFPVELRAFKPSSVPADPKEGRKSALRLELAALGLNEARSFPLVDSDSDDAQRLTNPLSAEESCLRMDLMTALKASVIRNWGAKERNIRLFEIGTVFRARPGDLPEETQRLAIVVSGARAPGHWTNAGKAPDFDVWDIKGLAEASCASWGVTGSLDQRGGDHWAVMDDVGRELGWAGPLAIDRPVWAAPVYGLEIDLSGGAAGHIQYAALPTTPAIERDVALVVPDGVTAGQIEENIRETAGALLESLYIFDEYRGDAVSGRSVAWRLVFRSPGRTLRDKDADNAVDRVLAALREQLNVERR
jgi:phenylalanyl-tRNA synthetase beta chain